MIITDELQLCNYKENIIPNLNKPDLKKLYICCCPNIQKIERCENLVELYITNCANLKCIEVSKFLNLKKLYIERCENLESIKLSKSIKNMILHNCSKINNIPNISFLEKLTIKSCHALPNVSSEIVAIKYISAYKILKWYKNIKFLSSKRYKKLWEIAEYYTAEKYKPENVIQYIYNKKKS